MATLRISGDTSGYIDLRAPTTGAANVFTFPAESGTIDRLNRAGNVLQVVQAIYSTLSSSSSSTYADTGLTASITPTSASSKILVLVNQAGCGKETNNTNLNLKLVRNSTDLIEFEKIGGYTATTAANYFGSCSACYLDSPATTSSTTYKTQFSSRSNNAVVSLQSAFTGGTSISTITLMEIAG